MTRVAKLFNTNELSATWEEGFYDSDWRPDTLHLTDFEKEIVESLTEALPRHMPVYDWNLPYAEGIILILRRGFAKHKAEKWCGCGDELRTDEDIRTGECGICRSLE